MDKKQQVMQWLEDHKQDYVELLQKLVRIPSISGNEYDVQMAVKEYAEAHGFTVEAKAFDPEGKRPNLRITYPGSGGGKRLMLDAHSDTVPVEPGENWIHDPFSGYYDGEWVYGRGATDNKWGITAILMTLRALKECDVKLSGDVIMQSAVGEEPNCDSRRYLGAGAMVRATEPKPDLCIVCEGSIKKVGTETPRNLKFSLKIDGKGCHPCSRRQCVFPQNAGIPSGRVKGVDALQKAMIIIDALYRLERELSADYDRGGLVGTGGAADAPRDTIGAVTITPIEIKGGGVNSLIPSIEMQYSAHYSAQFSREEMEGLIRSTIEHAANTDLWLREHPPVMEVSAANDGFYTDATHPLVDLVKQAHFQVYGEETNASGWPAGCNADAMNDVVPCVVYGPTGENAHTVNERSNVREVLDTCKVYAMAAMDFCK